jgi:hypothetical protein
MLRLIKTRPFESFLALWLVMIAIGIGVHAASALNAASFERWWVRKKPEDALALLGWSQAAAALLILGVLMWLALRHKRRLARGLCVACAHHLGPAPGSTICPECGAPALSTDSGLRSISWLRRRRLFLLIWLATIIVACVMFTWFPVGRGSCATRKRPLSDALRQGDPRAQVRLALAGHCLRTIRLVSHGSG